MASRSNNRHSEYDDPYVFDDPYRHSTSPIGNSGYEYVGTEEASVAGSNKPRRARSPEPEYRRSSPPKRPSRTTSPPRRPRGERTHTPPSKSRRSSPPRASRHASPHRTSSKKVLQDKHQDFSQRPGVKRTKSIGQQGMKFLSEAAALYAATQGGSGGRGRSESREYSHRNSRHDPEPRHRHHRRHSPTPSPSPPRRRQRAYSDDPPRRHRRRRSPSVSDDSDYDRDRGRHNRRSRANSYTQSPAPSSRRHRSRHAKSASSTYRSKDKFPDKDTADRWQMAARAALEAGGLTAFRLRKDPGSWTGEKGAKVATAALGAAAIDAFIDKDPRRAKSSGGVKGFAENTISSLIASKLMGFKGSSTRKGKSRY
ncbi:hypothetical protein F4804DRAFT_78781 [Jackrogersella minutella]|nr:hypothetical protein F4804DRAFT_78781 [Jackrogersella minutella]